jgi:glutamate/tyrosine decarboxylase-like PLP-dependent enzyme
MLKFKKVYNFTKITAALLSIIFFCSSTLYPYPFPDKSLRVPANNIDNERKVQVLQQLFQQRIRDLGIEYLCDQYHKLVYSGLSPQQQEELFKKYKLSESLNDVSIIFKAIDEILRNNMHFNQRYIGHMVTTVAELARIGDEIAFLIDSNQADPNTDRIYQLIEKQVILWQASMLGYARTQNENGEYIEPDGIVTSGGTTANMFAIGIMTAVTINKALKQVGYDKDIQELGLQGALELLGKEVVLFVPDERHPSWPKMGGYEGIGSDNIVTVKTDSRLCMDPGDLRKKIIKAKKKGKIILGIMATVGTTETGNIDPIEEISKIAKEHDIWFHIDAAYGWAYALSQDREIRKKISCMHLADSITMDGHKRYIPYNLGGVLVKDGRNLESLRPYFQEEGKGILAQTFVRERKFDALKFWMMVLCMGTSELGKAVDHGIRMTEYLYDMLRKDEDFEILSTREADLFTFRYIPPELHRKLKKALHKSDKEAIDEINGIINKLTDAIKQELQDSGLAWLSSTDMERSRYTKYSVSPEDNNTKLKALRVDAYNPFISEDTMKACCRFIKGISQKVAMVHAEEWELGKVVPTVKLRDREPVPETHVTHKFQEYFMHDETRDELVSLWREVNNLILKSEEDFSIDAEELLMFEEDLSNPLPPANGISKEDLLKKLEIIIKIAKSKGERKKISQAAMAGRIYNAPDPNNIGFEVGPASTYAEDRAVELLAELFEYRKYTIRLRGSDIDIPIIPGGIIVNNSTIANLTALLVARNLTIERLLNIDVTKKGYAAALNAIRTNVTKNKNTRMVIIASPETEKEMKELVRFIGMRPADVIVAKENGKGTISAKSLQQKVDEERRKGNIVMMVAVPLGEIERSEVKNIKKIFQDLAYKRIWVHTVIGTKSRASFLPDSRYMNSILRNSNSTTVDLQSLFSMPYGIGVILFQNEEILRQYLKTSMPYVVKSHEEGKMLNLSAYSPEGSKGFQALSLFLALILYGKRIKEAVAAGDFTALDREVFTKAVGRFKVDGADTTLHRNMADLSVFTLPNHIFGGNNVNFIYVLLDVLKEKLGKIPLVSLTGSLTYAFTENGNIDWDLIDNDMDFRIHTTSVVSNQELDSIVKSYLEALKQAGVYGADPDKGVIRKNDGTEIKVSLSNPYIVDLFSNFIDPTPEDFFQRYRKTDIYFGDLSYFNRFKSTDLIKNTQQFYLYFLKEVGKEIDGKDARFRLNLKVLKELYQLAYFRGRGKEFIGILEIYKQLKKQPDAELLYRTAKEAYNKLCDLTGLVTDLEDGIIPIHPHITIEELTLFETARISL